MTTRILPPEEWARLEGTGAAVAPALLADPENIRVIVVECGSAIVGTLVCLRVMHAECLWIDPAHRRHAGVAARLLRGLWGFARVWRAPRAIGGAVTAEMMSILERLGGVPIPGTLWSLPMR